MLVSRGAFIWKHSLTSELEKNAQNYDCGKSIPAIHGV